MVALSQRTVSNYLRISYLAWLIFGIVSLVVIPSMFMVKGDASLTAQHISSNPFLFRLSIVGALITHLLFIISPLLLYLFFKHVQPQLAALMVVFALVSIPISMYNELHKLTALLLLDNPSQMMQHLAMHEQGLIISSIFWGLWLFPLGQLCLQSSYFPRIAGITLILAGIGYVLSFLTKILLPDAEVLLLITEVLTMLELVFVLWVIIKGPKLG